ncbi:MAG: helix-hairpin-helix domain-containing protein [Halolamina sp.]
MILRKIKQLLGMGSAGGDERRSERDVVVQESSSGDAETEAAVKGVDEEGGESPGAGEVDEPVAAATDAGASTESLVDEEETTEHPESRAEPAEAAGQAPSGETGDTEGGTPVDEIKGIGPAYSERLEEVGVHNVAELAAADPAELAERITVSEKTVAKWVDRAAEHED